MLSNAPSSSVMLKAPLDGLKVVEFAGLAPGPFAGLVLADWGASVTRIDRVDQDVSDDVLCRGKRSLAVNPKIPAGRNLLLKIISDADVLIDPFRPGVLEKLGLGTDVFLGDNGSNERLIYARLTGFTRTGPYKNMAGHDINYIALSGVLSMLPGKEKPTFPLNLLADFAGGGLMCALGILLALQSRNITGKGQVVEVDMVSGARYIASFPLLHALIPNTPLFGNGHDHASEGRGTKTLDGGAPFYDVYTCADGRWMSVGCLEPQFFQIFIETFVKSLPEPYKKQCSWWPTVDARSDRNQWPQLRAFLEQGFRTRARDEWARIFHGTDGCAVPVLSPTEAAQALNHPIPLPHPSLPRSPLSVSSTKGGIQSSLTLTLKPGHHTVEILKELGFYEEAITNLVRSGVLGEPKPKL